MPKLDGILETALYVDDLERARAFYEKALELEPLYQDDRMRAYAVGSEVLLLFQRGKSSEPVKLRDGVIPSHDGAGPLHMAFKISAAELPAWLARLRLHKIAIEGRVNWPRGGESIYFRDPDGHLLELATPGLWANY